MSFVKIKLDFFSDRTVQLTPASRLHHGQLLLNSNALISTLIRHRSDAEMSDRCLTNICLRAFVIWVSTDTIFFSARPYNSQEKLCYAPMILLKQIFGMSHFHPFKCGLTYVVVSHITSLIPYGSGVFWFPYHTVHRLPLSFPDLMLSWRLILMCNKSTSAGTSLEGTPMFAHVTLHRTFNPLGSKSPWWQDVEAAS